MQSLVTSTVNNSNYVLFWMQGSGNKRSKERFDASDEGGHCSSEANDCNGKYSAAVYMFLILCYGGV